MATVTAARPTRKTYPAARCEVSVVRPIVYPCVLAPKGFPGAVTLNGDLYHIRAVTEPADNREGFDVLGYRFEKIGPDDSEPRDVECHPSGPVGCDCPDSLFRRRQGGECKHMRCVRQLRAEHKLI